MLESCGRAYFPIELNLDTRENRVKGQEMIEVVLVPMTSKTVAEANKTVYRKRVIDAGNLNKPAKLISASEALKEKCPTKNDPGTYVLGRGDVLELTEFYDDVENLTPLVRKIVVTDSGTLNIRKIGRFKVEGLTQLEVEELIQNKYIEIGKKINFELSIKEFRSKKIFVVGDNINPKSIPYTNLEMFLEDIFSDLNIPVEPGLDAEITLFRESDKFVFSMVNLLGEQSGQFRLFPNDKIYIKPLNYRQESIYIIGETGAQISLALNSIQRPSLSQMIFSGNVLNKVTSDFSQIYVIRKKIKKFDAYHLDITRPARIALATEFEMRPDDIVFVATQPLSLYSRTLSQILGSTGLTLQARDTIRTEIGN